MFSSLPHTTCRSNATDFHVSQSAKFHVSSHQYFCHGRHPSSKTSRSPLHMVRTFWMRCQVLNRVQTHMVHNQVQRTAHSMYEWLHGLRDARTGDAPGARKVRPRQLGELEHLRGIQAVGAAEDALGVVEVDELHGNPRRGALHGRLLDARHHHHVPHRKHLRRQASGLQRE